MSASTPHAQAASGPITRLANAWQARNPRERTLLIAAATVIGVALVVNLLDWSRSERARLGRSLPRAEAQLDHGEGVPRLPARRQAVAGQEHVAGLPEPAVGAVVDVVEGGRERQAGLVVGEGGGAEGVGHGGIGR